MSLSLMLTLYLVLGASLTGLRARQGWPVADASFGGLFWPLDLIRRAIDLMMGVLVEERHFPAETQAE